MSTLPLLILLAPLTLGAGPRQEWPLAAQPDKASETGAGSSVAAPRERLWAAGVRGGYTTVPNFVLGAFFSRYMPVNGYFLEGVAVRKLKSLRIHASLTATRGSADSGVWQRGPTKTPNEVFVNVTFLSADALFDWEVPLHRRFAFHFGAGVGLGVLFGTISSYECQNLAGACVYPQGQAPRDRKAEGWPLYPVLHLVAGARVNLTQELSLRADFDFRNAFGVALGLFYEI
jgi:hypothetical protein